jgi:hypothetical protein
LVANYNGPAVSRQVKGAKPNLDNNRVYDPRIDPHPKSKAKPSQNTVPISPSVKSFVQSLVPARPRSTGQIKALRRFRRELEQHLQVAQNMAGNPLVQSHSATTVSIKTIQELMPYHQQFRSAGLAVTSREQGKKTSRRRIKPFSSMPEAKTKK